MKVIIPMAGFGRRFIEAGYREPKPLIKVGPKRIIEYIIDMFSPYDEFIFICNEIHLKNTNMKSILYSLKPNAHILSVPQHSKGPVHTMQEAYNFIDDDEEVIVCYCDNPYLWNEQKFEGFIKAQKTDGCILTHSGFHPHRLSSTFMAYCKVDGNKLIEIKEKEPYTDNPMEEHASTGTYYFRKGSYVKKYFTQLIEEDITWGGEYYVTLVYNLMVQDKLNVTIYDTDYVTVFGTPEEVENFNAWNTILDGIQVKNEDELLKCYRYWKKYYELQDSQQK